MTVAALPAVADYQEDGVSTVFPVSFRFKAASDLVVVRIVAGVEVKLALGVDYTVTGGATDAGGTLTRLAATNGGVLHISRETARAQPMSYTTGDRFPAVSHEEALDRQMLIAQEQDASLADTAGRALLLPPGEAVGSLPLAGARAGQLLGFDPAGVPYMVDPSTVAVPLPGGLTTVISLFALASSISIPAGTDYVQTAGWSTRGRGAAYYVYDATVDAAYVAAHPRTAFVSKNGRGFRFAESVIDPAQVGANATGQTDDTAAVQASLDTGLAVHLAPGRTYLVSSPLRITADGVTVTGAGTIKVAPVWNFAADTDTNGTHLRVIFVTSNNVTLTGVTFDMTGVTPGTAVENGFIWSTGVSTTVTGCQFVGCAKGTCAWLLSAYATFVSNKVLDSTGAIFVRQRNAVISGNTIVNATDAAIALNGRPCIGAVVNGNTISNETGAPIPSMIAVEEGASRWTITGNTLLGINGGGIMCINVLDSATVVGGVIANNILDAAKVDGNIPTGDNPGALLSIAGTYTHWIAHDNTFLNLPLGNTNTKAFIIPSTRGKFHDNILDVQNVSGLVSLGLILPGTGGLEIYDNTLIGFPPANPSAPASYQGIGFLFIPGDYGSVPVKFRGGQILNCRIGINSDLYAANITNLNLEIENLGRTTCLFVTACTSAIGSRSDFLNAGAVLRPHRIGLYTDMSGTGAPTAAGTLPYQIGDKIEELTPTANGRMGVRRLAGAWVDYPYVAPASGTP